MSVHSQVHAAVKSGALFRATECEECGRPGAVVAHHDDYGRPLDVRWLCHSCHRRWHVTHGAGEGQETITTSVRIEKDKLAAFREVAEANRRSVSQELRWLIDRHVEEKAA